MRPLPSEKKKKDILIHMSRLPYPSLSCGFSIEIQISRKKMCDEVKLGAKFLMLNFVLEFTPSAAAFCRRGVSHFSTCRITCNNGAIRRDFEAQSEDYETYQRRRKTEWKRRQGVRCLFYLLFRVPIFVLLKGQTFLDHLIINVRGG